MSIKKKHYVSIIIGIIILIPAVFVTASLMTKKDGMSNSIDVEFVLIPKGTFLMGCHLGDNSPCKDNIPAHNVTISKPFYMSKYEITQAQWNAVMKNNPSKFKGDTNPVDRVSWLDVQEFIKRLNEMEKTTKYRLPTEAEWEYAYRAGAKTLYYFSDSDEALPVYAWYNDNSCKGPHPVGELKPNAWGLYDMAGNVWEWCWDTYDRDYYQKSPESDPQGPEEMGNKILRGGSWHSMYSYRLRSCFRFSYNFNGRLANVGFRLVKEL